MKRMLSTLLVGLFCLSYSLSAADATGTLQVDITKLTQQELLDYQKLKQRELAERANFNLQSLTPDNVAKYGEIGKAFGTAFKECWDTVSDDAVGFANSDAGKLTMILIAWKIVGQDGINLLEKAVQWSIGIPLLFFGTCFWIWLVRRNCTVRPQLVSKTSIGWFTVKREYEGNIEPIHDGEGIWGYAVTYAVFVGICCIFIFVG